MMTSCLSISSVPCYKGIDGWLQSGITDNAPTDNTTKKSRETGWRRRKSARTRFGGADVAAVVPGAANV